MRSAPDANQLPVGAAGARSVQRTASGTSVSSHGTAASHRRGAGAAAHSKARDMLRDYYGLNSISSAAISELDLNSPLFSEAAYMQHLMSTSTAPQLLRASTTLSGAIADLESERQGLVYNHHHELIEASITISKMKVRAESLDSTLEQLKAGLAKCTELEDGLRSIPDLTKAADSTAASPDWRNMLLTLLNLPMMLETADRSEAMQLWGTYEPVLRKWREAGVQDIPDIELRCRDILNDPYTGSHVADEVKQKRRRSSSIKVQVS